MNGRYGFTVTDQADHDNRSLVIVEPGDNGLVIRLDGSRRWLSLEYSGSQLQVFLMNELGGRLIGSLTVRT